MGGGKGWTATVLLPVFAYKSFVTLPARMRVQNPLLTLFTKLNDDLGSVSLLGVQFGEAQWNHEVLLPNCIFLVFHCKPIGLGNSPAIWLLELQTQRWILWGSRFVPMTQLCACRSSLGLGDPSANLGEVFAPQGHLKLLPSNGLVWS